MVYRGILPDTDYFFEDRENIESSKKRRLENKKNNLEQHLLLKRQQGSNPPISPESTRNQQTPTDNQTPTAENGNNPEQNTTNEEDIMGRIQSIASRHRRFSSAVEELKDQLPFTDKTAKNVATLVLERVEERMPYKFCREPNCTDPTHNHKKRSEEDGRRNSIEFKQSTAEIEKRRRNSIAVEEALKRRGSLHELGQRGFMKNAHISRPLQPAATDLEDRIENRMSKIQMERLGLVRRPSLANSLQPKAEALEGLIQRKNLEFSAAPVHPLSLSAGFKNEVAPKINSAAREVHRRRMSFKLNQALTGRRDYQNLVDDGIVISEYMAPSLQPTAFSLEDKLKKRVTEHYLKIKGVLPAKLELDYALQNVAGTLQKQLQRRPSLLESDDFLRRVLRDVDIEAIRPESDEEDNRDMEIPQQSEAKRRTVTNKLARRLSQRITPEQLQQRGVIPAEGDYFDDASSSIELKEIRRRLATEDLKKRMMNRATQQEIVQRGLTREEYFYMDKDQADTAVNIARKHTIATLSGKLKQLYNPFRQLENKGVVPHGYFEERAEQIRAGHRRQESVVAELHKKLLENPEYTEVVAQGIVENLDAPSDNDGAWNHDRDGLDSQTTDESGEDSDEEERRRLEELERRISRRPPQQELIHKHILYSTDIAPAIQNNSKELQRGLQRRKSIDDVKALGILRDDTTAEQSPNNPSEESVRREENGHNSQAENKRRPTTTDLELRGVVPQGYFDDVQKAIATKRRRKESIVGDLTARLAERPEYSRTVAEGLLEKALEHHETKQELEQSLAAAVARTAPTDLPSDYDKSPAKSLLQDKLGKETRPSYVDLQNKNILKKSFNPAVDAMANASAKAELERHALEHNLKFQLASRRDPEDMVDSGYLYYPVNQERALSPGLHAIAHQLEETLESRPPENYLAQKGIIQKEVEDWTLDQYSVRDDLSRRLPMRPQKEDITNRGFVPPEYFAHDPLVAHQQQEILKQETKQFLNKKLDTNKRPTSEALERSGIVPHGAFENAEQAQRSKEYQKNTITKELGAAIPNRSTREELVGKNILRGDGTNYVEESPNPPDAAQYSRQENNGSQQQPARRFAYQTNPRKPEIPDLIHQDVHEPLLEVDVLVPEPELNENTIKSSPLAFMNVLDSLSELSEAKIVMANQYIEQMKDKANQLAKAKASFYKTETSGSESKSNPETERLKAEIIQLQTELYRLDEEYRPIHTKLREISSVESDLEKYQDNYHAQLAQLRRVYARVNQVLQEHQTQRDSAMTALQATELQQGMMKSKISDKIAETLVKIDRLREQLEEAKQERIAAQSYATTITSLYTSYFSTPEGQEEFDASQKSPKELELEEELTMSNNFLTGLNEFLKGLNKLRKEQRNRITHVEQVIDQLHNQRAVVSEKIRVSETEAIEKLEQIRHEFLAPLQQQLLHSNKQQQQPQPFIQEEDENETKTYGPALTFEDVMRKRVNRMNRVYRKLRDLESRAMTTGSGEYLRGLTEIRELQTIMGNQYLKHFFNDFVNKANQVFHDFQLASIALLEQTATANDPVILDLAGIKMLQRVLTRNKRTIELGQDIEEMMRFVEAIPDREIVIMQVARHLALATPYKQFITGKHRPKSMIPSLPENDKRDSNNPYVILDLFINKLLEEWIGSICNAFGKSATTSVRAALEDDVIAQVRPSNAARLIVNCVWGLDGTL